MSTPSPTQRPGSAGTSAPALVAERLSRSYGDGVRALIGLSVCVGQGEFYGLLGPRGAGKTTVMRILAGLLPADGGRAAILGYDLRTHARLIRGHLVGYVSQLEGLDDRLDGRATVQLMARLHGLARRDAERRTDEVLAAFSLGRIADRRTGTYPLLARKRLALAAALVHRPRVLIVDDPTEGLGPQERATIWSSLRAVGRDDGVTIILATQHLEEVEGLCDRVSILDGGRVIAGGPPGDLKAQVKNATVAVRLVDPQRLAETAVLLDHMPGVGAIRPQQDRLELEVGGAAQVPSLLRLLEEHEVGVRDITLSRTSLDEVFFRHTGRKSRDTRESPATTEVPGRR